MAHQRDRGPASTSCSPKVQTSRSDLRIRSHPIELVWSNGTVKMRSPCISMQNVLSHILHSPSSPEILDRACEMDSLQSFLSGTLKASRHPRLPFHAPNHRIVAGLTSLGWQLVHTKRCNIRWKQDSSHTGTTWHNDTAQLSKGVRAPHSQVLNM